MYENNMGPADLAAVMGNRAYNGSGGFGFGDGAWWIIILFLFIFNGGWGNFGGNNTGSEVQRGFDQNALVNGINGLGNAINQGQSAISNQLSNIAMNQQNCCCENRAAVADLKYTVATEACADRSAISDALRDVLTANTASTQRILDQLCQDKIDAKNERIAELQNQLTMANLAATQNAQTAAIIANNEAQTAALEQYLAPVPRPAYVVQNPSCCQNFGYNCGCNA